MKLSDECFKNIVSAVAESMLNEMEEKLDADEIIRRINSNAITQLAGINDVLNSYLCSDTDKIKKIREIIRI